MMQNKAKHKQRAEQNKYITLDVVPCFYVNFMMIYVAELSCEIVILSLKGVCVAYTLT